MKRLQQLAPICHSGDTVINEVLATKYMAMRLTDSPISATKTQDGDLIKKSDDLMSQKAEQEFNFMTPRKDYHEMENDNVNDDFGNLKYKT